jgi:pimeloyl-ACP methyl ester carboxylesterase
MLHNSINEARSDNFTGTNRKTAVLAPQFFSTKFNSGQYKTNQLAWDDLNAWQPGGQANHPANTTLTSFDVLDGLVKLHSDKEKYPKLTNVTVVGHGGGGQLAQRYSALGNDPPDNVHVRYIHGDPSSCMYFTADRPILSDTGTSKDSCDSYNIWRYGFDKFPGTGGKRMTPKEYFTQYVSRDVVSIVGLDDTGSSGDTSCMGRMQGGTNRRARNLIWFRYINTLARTDEDLDGFPGSFEDLPDWSDGIDGNSHLRLVVVEGVDHNATELFQGNLGREALFHDGDIDEGWRPTND